MKMQLYCEHCGKPVKSGRSLEKSFKTDKWYKPGECPQDETQGCFIIGTDCAKKLLKANKDYFKHNKQKKYGSLFGYCICENKENKCKNCKHLRGVSP